MGNLSAFSAVSPNPPGSPCDALLDPTHVPDEYLSDDPAHASCSTNRRVERKKGGFFDLYLEFYVKFKSSNFVWVNG